MRVIEQTKPQAKTRDPLSDKTWQNTWVWHYRTGTKPERSISNRTANIMIVIFIAVMSTLAIGIIREVYIGSVCRGWQDKPLGQVSNICLKDYHDSL